MAGRGRKPGFVMGPEHRDKIKNSNILRELIKFAQGETPPEAYPPHRVTASLGLLRKIMPDMTENMVKGDQDAPLVTKIVNEIVNPPKADS